MLIQVLPTLTKSLVVAGRYQVKHLPMMLSLDPRHLMLLNPLRRNNPA